MAHRIGLRSGLVAGFYGLILILLSGGQQAFAQASGVNLLFDYRKAELKQDGGRGLSISYGLSFQHDFKDRIGMGITASMVGEDASTFELMYDSKYFTSDNEDQTAFYIGSFLGYRSLKASYYDGKEYQESSQTQLPVGLQVGVRGGLPGYFGELKVKVGYCIGSGSLGGSGDAEVTGQPLYLGLGVAYLGFGWD